MKFISWNVNGIRACVQKGFIDFFKEADADIFCIQETKMQEGQLELDLPGYFQYWNYAEKKGYSGTAVFTKKEPLSVSYGIGIEEHDHEGRVITLEYGDFYFVTVYTPNSQNELLRLPYRMRWEEDFLAYLKALEEKKPVVFCGDLNVAHKETDLKNPKTNRKNAGFTDEERQKFTEVLEFIGRLPVIFTLEGLSRDMMVQILKEPRNAILKQYQKLLELDEVELLFNEGALEAIADKAMEKETGARALRAIIEEFMLDIMYEVPKDDNIGRVTITKEYIEGNGGPIIDIRSRSAEHPDRLKVVQQPVSGS